MIHRSGSVEETMSSAWRVPALSLRDAYRQSIESCVKAYQVKEGLGERGFSGGARGKRKLRISVSARVGMARKGSEHKMKRSERMLAISPDGM